MTRVERIALAALLGAAVVVWALVVSHPNYDAYYHLVWGRELLDGESPSFEAYQAPTQHPLYLVVAAVAGLAGEAGDRLLVLFTALSHAVFTFGVYVLGRRVFGAPAGVIAAVFAGSSFALLLYAARAYVDTPFLALVVWAGVLEAARPRRGAAVLGLLAVAGLLRPEAWVLSGIYWLWLAAAPEGRGRALVAGAGMAASAPLLWALTDLTVTGDPLFSLHSTSELAEELGRARGLDEVPRAFVTFLADTAREPVAVLGVAGLALAWAARGRLLGAHVVFGLFGAGVLTFVATGLAGLSVLPRYLTVPAVALMLLAAYAAVRAWERSPRLTGAGAVVGLLGVGLLLPGAADRLFGELRFTREIHDDLRAVLVDPRVRAARACGPVTLPNYRLVPDARWILDASRSEVGSRSARERERGVALFLIGEKALRRYGFADGASPLTNVPRPGFTPTARVGSLVAYTSC